MHHALLYLLATLAGSMLTALVYAVHKKAEGGANWWCRLPDAARAGLEKRAGLHEAVILIPSSSSFLSD